MRQGVGAAVVGLMLAGCSSGSSPHAAAVTSPTAATHAPSGVVGGIVTTIDRARLLSVCENARTADTALAGGDTATVGAAVSSAVTLLLKPPVDTEAQAAGHVAQRLVAQGHRDQAVTALTTFCRRHNA